METVFMFIYPDNLVGQFLNEIVTSESGVLLDPHFSAQELADQIVRVYEHKDRFHPRRLWEEKFNAGKNYPRFISQILND